MQGSADIPGQQPDARQPFTVSLSSATSVGLSPRWVQYSGVSAAACALALVLVDLATMATHGDQLDPYLDELQQLGFLMIDDGDRFSSSLHPPAGYTGPRNLTEANARFAAKRAETGE
jgi:hypothetical protein